MPEEFFDSVERDNLQEMARLAQKASVEGITSLKLYYRSFFRPLI